jgi:hypothetical protein
LVENQWLQNLTLILAPQGSSCRIVKTVTALKPLICVLGTKSNGWHDIAFRVQGGGVVRAYQARLSFNGKIYTVGKRSSEKAAGEVIVPLDVEQKPLFNESGGKLREC